MQTKPKKKVVLIEKPFFVGKPIDSATSKRGLSVLGTIAISMFLYLIIGSVMLSDSIMMRVITTLLFTALFIGLAYSNGLNTGFQDVANAEIVARQLQEGKQVDETDKDKCYHPLKGWVSGFIGILPIFLLAIVLAVLTQPVLYERSVLPSWLSGLERRTEVGNALQFYHTTEGFTAIDIIRVIIRLMIMPFIALVGTDNVYALTLVERLSPLIVLLLPAGYGLGYFFGRKARAKVHGDIALNRKKQKRREQKRIRQGKKQKEPEQLI